MGQTSITVSESTKRELDAGRLEHETWDEYLVRLRVEAEEQLPEPEDGAEAQLRQRDLNRIREAVRTEVRDTLETLTRH